MNFIPRNVQFDISVCTSEVRHVSLDLLFGAMLPFHRVFVFVGEVFAFANKISGQKLIVSRLVRYLQAGG